GGFPFFRCTQVPWSVSPGGVAVQSPHPTFVVVRNVLLLALLGVAGLILAGPILAVLSVALSVVLVVGAFALVGLFFWGLFQLLVRGPRAAGRSVAGLARGLGRGLAAGLRSEALYKVAVGLVRLPVLVWQKGRGLAELAVVTASGVLVGVAVGLLPGPRNQG